MVAQCHTRHGEGTWKHNRYFSLRPERGSCEWTRGQAWQLVSPYEGVEAGLSEPGWTVGTAGADGCAS